MSPVGRVGANDDMFMASDRAFHTRICKRFIILRNATNLYETHIAVCGAHRCVAGIRFRFVNCTHLSRLKERGRSIQMEKTEMFEPEYFFKDGKLTRRTFVKGVGFVTIASAFGFAEHGEIALAEEVKGASDETAVHAVCTVNCTSRCHLHGTVRDGRLVRVEPGDMPGRPGYANACLRSMSYIQRLQDETARVMYPMKRTGERGSGEFERITWDEAMDVIAEKLNAVLEYNPQAASFYSFTGRSGQAVLGGSDQVRSDGWSDHLGYRGNHGRPWRVYGHDDGVRHASRCP